MKMKKVNVDPDYVFLFALAVLLMATIITVYIMLFQHQEKMMRLRYEITHQTSQTGQTSLTLYGMHNCARKCRFSFNGRTSGRGLAADNWVGW